MSFVRFRILKPICVSTSNPDVSDCAQQRNHEDDRDGKQIRDDDREKDLYRDLLRRLLGSFEPAGPDLSGLDAKNRRKARAHPIRLNNRPHEVGYLLHLNPVGKIREGLLPGLTDLRFLHNHVQLVPQRSRRPVHHDPFQGGAEVQSRFHGQGQQVATEWKVLQDRELSLFDLPVHKDIGEEKAEYPDQEDQRRGEPGDEEVEPEAEQAEQDCARLLDAQVLGRLEVPGPAGCIQLLLDHDFVSAEIPGHVDAGQEPDHEHHDPEQGVPADARGRHAPEPAFLCDGHLLDVLDHPVGTVGKQAGRAEAEHVKEDRIPRHPKPPGGNPSATVR